MSWASYGKFREILLEHEESSDEDMTDGPRTEEAMMKAFVTLHEQRLQVDGKLKGCEFAHVLCTLKPCSRIEIQSEDLPTNVITQYDTICTQLMVVDRTRDEKDITFVGHALEVSRCRLVASRLAYLLKSYGLARQRSSQAIWACEAVLNKSISPLQHSALQLLRETLVDSLVVRSMASLQQGNFLAAQEDAMLARSKSRCWRLHAHEEETLALAIRCEMALHAGGPGNDGHGCRMAPEAACAIQLDHLTDSCAAFTTSPVGTADLADPHMRLASSPDTFVLHAMD